MIPRTGSRPVIFRERGGLTCKGAVGGGGGAG